MDVSAWLRELGLGQYEEAFRDNAIDAGVLPSLTSDDLKELGIGPLEHRRRLLDAIATVRAGTNLPSAPPLEIPSTPPSPAPELRDSAERRPITVMFCDLVGSTSMAANMDAEDWRDLVGIYLDEASKAVTQFGGHVLKKLGDGLMALFGYPKAQENDAERAARAGLAILRALEDLNAKNISRGLPALAARIGLQSGPVVVDSSGEVFGDAPNVAARVQAAAEPGTLFVTALVQRQVAGFFVAEDKGPHNLTGVSGQPVLYRLLRASGGGRKVGARLLTALVGREEELATLARRWERAKAGDGQFVQIVGEPGLGKSRLIDEFRIRLAETPHTWVEWSSSQLLQNTPLHPLVEWGRQRFAGEAKFFELEAALAQVKLDPAEHAPLLASLLDIATPDGRAPQLAADELRRRQLMAVVAWILAGARVQPLVLAFEDLHWADPTTLDLMKTLGERGGQAPFLIVATARPEFRAPWTTRSHHGVISLSPLDRAQIAQMVGAIAARHALSKDLVEGLSDRTAGVPLFIEELTRLMLEGGAQTVPPTLQQSLAARLDRLGEAREVAQIGAVLGREFSHGVLTAIADLDAPTLDAALGKLADADLMFVEGVAPAATYRFKHALIQDAAYASLLKTRRQALHRRAAEALITASDPQPELVAHHFSQSNQTELAIEWWGKAGDAALRRSAFQEAISHLNKAIEMADKEAARNDASADAAARRERRAELQIAYGNSLIASSGYHAPETRAAFLNARELVSLVSDPLKRMSSYYGLWVGSFVRAELDPMQEVAAHIEREISATPHAAHTGVADRIVGETLWFTGDFVLARPRLERALALFDRTRDQELGFSFGQDLGVTAAGYLAFALAPMGEMQSMRSHIDCMVDRAAEVGNVASVVFAGGMAAIIWGSLWQPLEAAQCVASILPLANEHKMELWSSYCSFSEAWASWRSTYNVLHLDTMRRAIGSLRERQILLFMPMFETQLAWAEADAGYTEAALASIARALETTQTTKQRWFEAETRRVHADILVLMGGDPAAAETNFRSAATIARQQCARAYALQTALSFARLLTSTNRMLEAHDVIAGALDGFTATPELPAIAEAQALLAELSQSK